MTEGSWETEGVVWPVKVECKSVMLFMVLRVKSFGSGYPVLNGCDYGPRLLHPDLRPQGCGAGLVGRPGAPS